MQQFIKCCISFPDILISKFFISRLALLITNYLKASSFFMLEINKKKVNDPTLFWSQFNQCKYKPILLKGIEDNIFVLPFHQRSFLFIMLNTSTHLTFFQESKPTNIGYFFLSLQHLCGRIGWEEWLDQDHWENATAKRGFELRTSCILNPPWHDFLCLIFTTNPTDKIIPQIISPSKICPDLLSVKQRNSKHYQNIFL